ncbi:MAG: hypothetical protein C4K60_02635 [Ideonella sp. MAG2]|nr:MAG: hypothetical protein C4K60_02635 [Ideonella sp. MAG2]
MALVGWGAAAWRPAWVAGRLSVEARQLWSAIARAVLEGVLPADKQVQALALEHHLGRLETAIQGLAPATRAELSELMSVLGMAPGRLALTGLSTSWGEATVPEVQASLQAMRLSNSQTRQQVYHALRDLTNAAWFSDAGSWVALGYPGPRPV